MFAFWIIATFGLLLAGMAAAYYVSLRFSKRTYLGGFIAMTTVLIFVTMGIWFGTLRQAGNARDREFFASGIQSCEFKEDQGLFVCYKVTNGVGDWAYLSFNKQTGRLRYSDICVPESTRNMGQM